MKPVKICLFCEHFVYSAATPDWSEVTPGDDVEMYCKKAFWSLDIFEDTQSSYREKILNAKTCLEYKFDIDLLDEGID